MSWFRSGAQHDTRRPRGCGWLQLARLSRQIEVFTARTTASSETKAYKEQVRSGVADAAEIPVRAVWLQLAFVVSPRRNWLNLWKPTIDALDPLLGRTRTDRDWHPRDGRITELGLHLTIDPDRRHDVTVCIATGPADV